MSTSRRSGAALPAHVTLPLLTLITEQAIDQDYRLAAARRSPGQLPTPRSRTLVLSTTIAVALFGTIVAVAFSQTARQADAAALSRAALIERVQTARARAERLQARASELRAENAAAEKSVDDLRAKLADTEQRVRRLQARTGLAPVKGPGVVAVVTDAPGGTDSQTVRDTDLVRLVDGLWAAGAEAIAINGQRLTALSSIQNSGRAIHVNSQPLAPPYTISAIGDPRTMAARLVNTTHGAEFLQLSRTLEFGFDIRNDDELRLPAARWTPLRSVRGGSSTNPKARQEEMT